MQKFKNRWNSMPMDEKIKIALETDRVNNIGALNYNQDNMDEAIAQFQKALQIMPINDDAIKNLINSYQYTGQLDKVAHYTKLLEQLEQ